MLLAVSLPFCGGSYLPFASNLKAAWVRREKGVIPRSGNVVDRMRSIQLIQYVEERCLFCFLLVYYVFPPPVLTDWMMIEPEMAFVTQIPNSPLYPSQEIIVKTEPAPEKGYVRVSICCDGWVREEKNHHVQCRPICENKCLANSSCVAPNTCQCNSGFTQLDNKCISRCPDGCLNGKCNGISCSCNWGYVLHSSRLFCLPYCDGGCGPGGECTGPNNCTCAKGYVRDKKTHKCTYTCEGGCGDGICTGINKCSCLEGYKFNAKKCIPQCPKGCKDGECIGPNICSCIKGWNYDLNAGGCKPICDQPCQNGICVAPNTCQCKIATGKCETVCGHGFKFDTTANECVPVCSRGCANGWCEAPEKCACVPGWSLNKNGTVCTPMCSVPCINGNCVAPNECQCNLGYQKPHGEPEATDAYRLARTARMAGAVLPTFATVMKVMSS
ncbi:hypothetical protein NQ317_008957 [Molorchus minor]|uniref:EGF-like domain-containing protein n=1 Tax=Molorchus minor TaxID=1323400 RepID=A0ABQ9K178_9CUCU|nr:hypothetical protein NQ317_008957 [Molorchus minor]